MNVTAFSIAQRFIGLKEAPGSPDNPAILAMLKLDNDWPEGDEVPWCSAFVNYVAWLLGLPRSRSLAARSWLGVGTVIELKWAKPENDVVILSRSSGGKTAGHVGLYSGQTDSTVALLGGNQGDKVSVAEFSLSRLLGVRRLG